MVWPILSFQKILTYREYVLTHVVYLENLTKRQNGSTNIVF